MFFLEGKFVIKKYNKKGSHISFIISFVIFVSFLIFFIGIIKPLEKVETGKSSLLKHLENEIIEDVSDEVLVVSALEDAGNVDCSNIRSLSSKKVKTIKDDVFFKFYFSDEFTNDFQCDATKDYEIGLVRTQNYILESKILKLNENYNVDYNNLKNNLGIPEANDFEFSFLDDSKVIITEAKSKETPPTEVFAELVPINYLNKDAEIKTGYLRVAIW